MIDIDSYLNNGYYFGHVQEIFQDMSVFYKFAEEAKKLTATKSVDKCFYINDIVGGGYNRELSVDDVDERRQTIKNNSLVVDQQWWIYSLHRAVNPRECQLFRNEISKYMITIYSSAGLTVDNIAHGDNITLYEEGDFSTIHQDGQNTGRYSAILIYFGNDYNDGGGEFIIGDGIKISPVIGNFVILDFTTHNIPHGVGIVKNGFKRIAYLNFISNLDKI